MIRMNVVEDEVRKYLKEQITWYSCSTVYDLEDQLMCTLLNLLTGEVSIEELREDIGVGKVMPFKKEE